MTQDRAEHYQKIVDQVNEVISKNCDTYVEAMGVLEAVRAGMLSAILLEQVVNDQD